MECQNLISSEFKALSRDKYNLPLPLLTSIDKIVKEEGYLTHKIISRSISTNGGNFMADLYEVDIKGETADGHKDTNIFIKSKIENSKLAVLDVDECYGVENFFYGQLSKVYDELQNNANIPLEERFAIVKNYDVSNPSAIILENLNKKGFSTLHRMEVPPLPFMELAIQQLARFHGLSWVLEKQNPEFFETKIRTMKAQQNFGKDYQDFIDNMSKYTEKYFDEELKPGMQKLKSRMLLTLKQYHNDNKGSRCCLCHGDYWINNILMRKDGDNITEVIPVDYQLLYYGCPVMDFHYLICLCTDSEFRRKHLDNLKDLYYDSLAKFLKHFDMDVASVYPRHEFEEEYNRRLDFALIMGLLLSPVVFTSDDDIPDINNTDMASVTVTPDTKMDDRIRGLIDDFQKWGIL